MFRDSRFLTCLITYNTGGIGEIKNKCVIKIVKLRTLHPREIDRFAIKMLINNTSPLETRSHLAVVKV